MADYINKEEFRQLLIKYEKTKSRKVYNELGKYFLLVARNLLNHPWFIKYSPDRKEAMVSDSCYFMCKYIDRFDVRKDQPFSYFTQIAWNAFRQYIILNKKIDELIRPIDYIENITYDENNNLEVEGQQ